MAIKNGRLVAVGTAADVIAQYGRSSDVVDLQGRFVTPVRSAPRAIATADQQSCSRHTWCSCLKVFAAAAKCSCYAGIATINLWAGFRT